MENNNVLDENLNTSEELVDLDTTEEQSDSNQSEESVESLKAKLEKSEAEKNNQRIRAEKAERQAKVEVKPEPAGLTSKDTIAIINAKVHEDDVDDVLDYAKYKKISVAEALKSSVIKASLAEKDELRNTAQATSTGKVRSGSSKVSGDILLAKARKTGELPDSDEGMDALVESRLKR